MYILGILEDNTGLLVLPKLFNMLAQGRIDIFGYPFGIESSIKYISEPLYFILFFFLSLFTDPINIFNLLNVLTLFLIGYFSYKLYFYVLKNRFISSLLSILSVINPYLLYHIRSHPQLSQIWLLFFLIYFILKNKLITNPTLKNSIYLGIVLSLTFITSNYLGLFSLIFYSILSLLNLIVTFHTKQYKFLKSKILYSLSTLAVFTFTTAVLLFPFLTTLLDLKDISIKQSDNQIVTTLNRPIEDFITFSSRPWYLFLPSVDNPFYGHLTTSAISFLQNRWGNYLTYNYFKSEHSSAFLSITNLVVSIFGLLYVYKNKSKIDKNILYILFSLVLLFLFSLPPVVVINGFNFYNLSYLIWTFLPMFRVLVRIGILFYIVFLILVGFGYKNIFDRLNYPFNYILVLLLMFLSVSELLVPIKITTVPQTPNSIRSIIENTQNNSVIAVYPYDKTNFIFFWQRELKLSFINPIGYISIADNFDSEVFTKSLSTCEGLLFAKSIGMTHLVNYDLSERFFKSNNILILLNMGYDTDDSVFAREYFFIKQESAGNKGGFEIYQIDSNISNEKFMEDCIEV